MTHDEALQAVAADMHAALKAWQEYDHFDLCLQNYVREDGEEFFSEDYLKLSNSINNAQHHARTLTSAVNHRIAELCADSVTPVTLDMGGDE